MGCDTYSSRRWAVPLSAAISIIHDPPCLPTGRLYLSRENRGRLGSVRNAAISDTHNKSSKAWKTFWWRDRQSSRSSEAVNVTIETPPQTDNLQLLIHYTVFSGRLYALVGLEAMVRLYPTLIDPGDTTKREWLPQLDLKNKSRNRVLHGAETYCIPQQIWNSHNNACKYATHKLEIETVQIRQNQLNLHDQAQRMLF